MVFLQYLMPFLLNKEAAGVKAENKETNKEVAEVLKQISVAAAAVTTFFEMDNTDTFKNKQDWLSMADRFVTFLALYTDKTEIHF